ncbi:MAG: tetratricopeptide repeat protein [Chthoniobacter sp.]|nr:tetratricopeptide repeat protein [Chthoniobacter sp.]
MPTVTVDQAFQIAVGHHQKGQLAEAGALCRQILAAQPQHFDAMHLLGWIAVSERRYQEALPWFSKAMAQASAPASYHCDLGTVHGILGQPEQAVLSFRKALDVDPDNAVDWSNLSEMLLRLGQLDDAISCGQSAVEVRPDFAEGHNNLGNALRDKGRCEQAVEHFRRALSLRPDFAEAHNNLGYALMEMNRWEEAITSCQCALTLKPDFAKAHLNLGAAHLGKGDVEKAEPCFGRAIACLPNFPEAHWNHAITLLLLGRYEEGWREFEWRCRTSLNGLPLQLRGPHWDGGTAENQTILVYPEQGYGDAIHFARYLPLVRQQARARKVIFLCPTPLAPLMEQTEGWNAELIVSDNWSEAALPHFDQHISLLGLPMALRAFDPLRTTGPYLRANPELRAAWRGRLRATSKFRVGLAWAGNSKHVDDDRRSVDPGLLVALLRLPGIEVYSLQLKMPNGLPSGLAEAGLIDLAEQITDFADTAAFMEELDLIISVDTAVAHLAGALGRPVWTLLPFVPDWRWGLEREDTPWYPTMRLFRQPALGDWDAVIQRVAGELKALVSQRCAAGES